MIIRGSDIVKAAAALIAFFVIAGTQADASVEYTIRKGDNPSRIAKKFKVSVKAIVDENGLSEKNMMPGTRITIPANKNSSGKNASAHKASGKTACRKGKKENGNKRAKDTTARIKTGQENKPEAVNEKTASAKPLSGDIYHVVKKGDTIASVSRKYSLTAEELKELNKLKSSKLKKGRKLLVKRIGPKTYIVKKGDNIWRIARKFEVDADDLMELNEMSSSELKVGQKLFLEEVVDQSSAESIGAVVPKNFEEEIRKVSETQEFKEKDEPNKLITFARKLMNIPYKFGGNSILGIDCSGYVKKVYGLLGVELPRTAREQFKEGEAIDMDELSVGDLVFFRTYASFPSHVGIYLGNNLFIHASSKGKKVTIDSLETPYYLKRFIGGKRLLTEREHDDTELESSS